MFCRLFPRGEEQAYGKGSRSNSVFTVYQRQMTCWQALTIYCKP